MVMMHIFLSFMWKATSFFIMNFEMDKLEYHKAYGSFPKGCYISITDGLKTFDDTNKELDMEVDESTAQN